MDLDAPVCLCFGVTRRKLLQYLRVERPRVASQLSDCGGAGTGCGWCVPHLRKLFADPHALDTLSWADYEAGRDRHRTPTTESVPPAGSMPMTETLTAAVSAWLDEFATEPSVTKLNLAFGEVIASEPENVNAQVATQGLGAGEVVATMAGVPPATLPDGVMQWAKANAAETGPLLIEARIAVERVHAGAEVAGLGNTPAGDVAGCQAAAAELLLRLG